MKNPRIESNPGGAATTIITSPHYGYVQPNSSKARLLNAGSDREREHVRAEESLRWRTVLKLDVLSKTAGWAGLDHDRLAATHDVLAFLEGGAR